MPVPPTQEEWESFRATITDMYSRRPLKIVRTHMKNVYGFHATDRMYKGRFKTWGIEKNRRLGRPQRTSVSRTSPPAPSPCVLPTFMTPPGHSPPSSYPDSDCYRSATYSATPAALPPTPESSRHRSPTVPDVEEQLDVNATCQKIVDLAVCILSRLENRDPTQDHVEIFQTLQNKLRHESKLRGCLVNRQQGPTRAPINEIVKDMLNPLHPAAPIGVLSTFNQLSDDVAIHELAQCLVASSSSNLPSSDDFTQLSLAIHSLLGITERKTFVSSMAKICETLEDRILALLGSRSLVRVYLSLLLNAKKAKIKHEKDQKLFNMALERTTYVQRVYAHNAKLVLDFSLLVVAYLALVTPGDNDVLGMAELCYERAEGYLRVKEESGENTRDAKLHFGKSCAYLAECRYAQGEENPERRNSARELLLYSIYCHSECAEATLPHVERQMAKLEIWCNEADDTERLQHLEGIRAMIEGKEQRPKGEPLLPRLPRSKFFASP